MPRFTLRMEQPAVDAVMTLERELLDPAVRSDKRQVEKLLATDFTEIDRSGRLYSRAEVLRSIGGFESSWGASTVSSEMEGRMLADDLVLLTYLSDSASGRCRRSSVWRHLHTSWYLVFHQGTALHNRNFKEIPVSQ